MNIDTYKKYRLIKLGYNFRATSTGDPLKQGTSPKYTPVKRDSNGNYTINVDDVNTDITVDPNILPTSFTYDDVKELPSLVVNPGKPSENVIKAQKDVFNKLNEDGNKILEDKAREQANTTAEDANAIFNNGVRKWRNTAIGSLIGGTLGGMLGLGRSTKTKLLLAGLGAAGGGLAGHYGTKAFNDAGDFFRKWKWLRKILGY